MEIRDRVLALLGIAKGPVGIDVLTQIVAPDDGLGVSGAVLELVLSGMATADARGVLLADEANADGIDAGIAADAPEPEPEPEPEPMLASMPNQEPGSDVAGKDPLSSWALLEPYSEGQINSSSESPFIEDVGVCQPKAAAQTTSKSSALSDEDVLRMAFTEDSIDELLSLREEHARAQKLAEEERERRTVYVHGKCSVGHVSVPKYTATRLKSAGVPTVKELIKRGVSPKSLGVTAHIALNVSRALDDLPILFPRRVSMSQLAAARRVSGNDKYGFDMFCLAVRLDEDDLLIDSEDAQTASFSFAEQFSSDVRELVESARLALDPDGWFFWQPMFEVIVLPLAKKALEYSHDPLEAVLDEIWDMAGFVERSTQAINVAIDKRDDIQERYDLGSLRLSSNFRWQDIIEPFVKDLKCDFDTETGVLSRHRYTLSEWLDTLPEDRARVLRMRFEGRTLQEVGLAVGLTRERIRQLQSQYLKDRPKLKEDDYLHLVETYAISSELFCSLTGEEPFVFGYLDAVAARKRSARSPVELAVNDDNVDSEIRAKLASSKTDSCLLVDGKHVPKKRLSVTKAILAQIPSNESVSLDWLMNRYLKVIEENDEANNPSLKLTSRRAYDAWIDRQPGILYAAVPKSFDSEQRAIRLYDHKGKPFYRLESYLQSWSKRNIECSTRLVYEADSFKELRELLDIRNGYELHVVIRRFCGQMRGVSLGRSPMIFFGRASRRDQLEQLIRSLGPISATDLSAAYEEAYGVDAFLVQMNYLKEVSSFRMGDYYEDTGAGLTKDQSDYLASLLTEDVNVLREVRREFSKKYPSVDASAISARAFSGIGFEVRRELVVREGFDMRAYANALISSLDRFEVGMESLPEELFKDEDFQSVLKTKLRGFSVVEIAQGSYRSMRSLQWECPQLSEELLRDYVEAVISQLKQDEVETLYSLKKRGFAHPLDEAIEGTSLNEDFLAGVASMGYVGGRLKRSRHSGTMLLSRRGGSLTVDDFVESIVRRYGTTDPRMIHKIMLEDYDVRMNGGNVRMILNKLLDAGLEIGDSPNHLLSNNEVADDTEESSELADAILDCVGKSGRMPVARLMNRLHSQYGIDISAAQLRSALRDVDVRFDERRDFVYSK